VNFFLKEIPLRKSFQEEPGQAVASASPDAATAPGAAVRASERIPAGMGSRIADERAD